MQQTQKHIDRPWFDRETGLLLLDEYVSEMPSFRRIMADEVVTEEELDEHAGRTIELLHWLEEMLPEDAREVATEALCELAVLYALERRRERAY